MSSFDYILVGASVLLLISVIASKASGRLGVPALLIFLGIGMLAGSEGPGGIEFDNASLAQSLGVVALSFILFAGGLETQWQAIRPEIWRGLSLSTLGVVITAALVGLFATWVLKFSLLEGLLLGSVVSSTDAAAVFSVLRSRSVGLKGGLKPLLELESGSNDPMAVFLTLGLIRIMSNPEASLWNLVPAFFLQMGLGAILGFVLGKAMIVLLNRLRLEYEGLYPVFSLAGVLFIYGISATAGGNGFLAVYVAGILLGNNEFIHKKSLILFHDGLAWLMQITMFLALGLLVFPKRLPPVAGVGLLISLFLMFVARPISVFAGLLFARLNIRRKLMISWVGLRGAAPIILATFPLVARIPKADTIFHLVFFIVLTSVLMQGTTIPQAARRLRVAAPLSKKRQYPLEFVPAVDRNSDLVEITIPEDSPILGKQIVDLRLPKNALIVLINRNENFIVPRGGTILESGDQILVLSDKKALADVRSIVEAKEKQALEESPSEVT
ncbi:MAG: potassium/proton antiporter [Terriglobia bacterium]